MEDVLDQELGSGGSPPPRCMRSEHWRSPRDCTLGTFNKFQFFGVESEVAFNVLSQPPRYALDLGLQSRIKFLTKQATIRSYPRSLLQGLGINFCLHHFRCWACINRSVSITEPCWSLATFASIKCPRSLRSVLDLAGRNDGVSTPHDPVQVC